MTDAAHTRWLSDTELAAWIPFSGMLIGLLSALDTQLRDAKLSLFGYCVLAGLSEAPERTLVMSELAVRAGGSLSRLSHAVSALERQGWVTRHPAPANRRITLATLTEAGYAKLVASAPAHIETVRRLIIDPLTTQELRQLGRVSETILTELNATSERPPRQDLLGAVASVTSDNHKTREALMAAKFEISKDHAGKFRFRLKAPNGEIIAASQGYETKANAEKGIEAIKTRASTATVEDHTDAKSS